MMHKRITHKEGRVLPPSNCQMKKEKVAQERRSGIVVLITIFAVIISLCWTFHQTTSARRSASSLSQHAFPDYSVSDKESGATPTTNELLVPQQVLEVYKKQHGAHVLQSETNAQLLQRKYASAYYSCPHQAGNRLHSFMNSVLHAMISNRTVLYHYYDSATCWFHHKVQTQVYMSPEICESANQEQDCSPFLERAKWIPSYQDIAHRLDWPLEISNNTDMRVLDYWSIIDRNRAPSWMKQRYGPVLNTTMEKMDQVNDILVDFPSIKDLDRTPGKASNQQAMLATEHARQTATALYSEGAEFLYGMLLSDMLPFRFQQASSLDADFSIALHSRHKKSDNDGSNTRKEQNCLDKVLQQRQSHQSCSVCLMSDRPKTITSLTEYLQTRHNCTGITVHHDSASHSFLDEHGPNAGAGFLKELHMCQHATSAFVGMGSSASSTSLLRELVSYQRRLGRQSSETSDTTTDMYKCLI